MATPVRDAYMARFPGRICPKPLMWQGRLFTMRRVKEDGSITYFGKLFIDGGKEWAGRTVHIAVEREGGRPFYACLNPNAGLRSRRLVMYEGQGCGKITEAKWAERLAQSRDGNHSDAHERPRAATTEDRGGHNV